MKMFVCFKKLRETSAAVYLQREYSEVLERVFGGRKTSGRRSATPLRGPTKPALVGCGGAPQVRISWARRNMSNSEGTQLAGASVLNIRENNHFPSPIEEPHTPSSHVSGGDLNAGNQRRNQPADINSPEEAGWPRR